MCTESWLLSPSKQYIDSTQHFPHLTLCNGCNPLSVIQFSYLRTPWSPFLSPWWWTHQEEEVTTRYSSIPIILSESVFSDWNIQMTVGDWDMEGWIRLREKRYGCNNSELKSYEIHPLGLAMYIFWRNTYKKVVIAYYLHVCTYSSIIRDTLVVMWTEVPSDAK